MIEMRDYKEEFEKRVQFIKDCLEEAHCRGIVYGNSGGKDSALVGILCKAACDNTLGVMMPCQSKRNFGEDMEDGLAVARQFNIDTIMVDLTAAKEAVTENIEKSVKISETAGKNIAPRLRMTTVYAIAQTMGALVAGTGNRSERYTGYFTKWGDGAFDFNPISDLSVGEIYEFLEYLDAPENIIRKAPSAGLFEGQTDEKEMGVTYDAIDRYMMKGEGSPEDIEKIRRMHEVTAHKRTGSKHYCEIVE